MLSDPGADGPPLRSTTSSYDPGGYDPHGHADHGHARRPQSLLFSAVVGVVAGMIGLAPHLLEGGRLPLQNLWASQTEPTDMPFAFLPISQYAVVTIVVMLVVGGLLSGLAIRAFVVRGSLAPLPASLGLLGIHLLAAAQSFIVLANGLQLGGPSTDSRAAVYFTALLVGTSLSILLAQAAFWLTSRPSQMVCALGIALAAVPFAAWINAIAAALLGPAGLPPAFATTTRWLAAVLVGLALAWCGFRPPHRLAVWMAGLLALWVTPALITALQYSLGSRLILGDVSEMIAAGSQVFRSALTENTGPLIVGLAIASVGSCAKLLLDSRSPNRGRAEAA